MRIAISVVRALHSTGDDVLAVSEFQQRAVDSELMELAHRRSGYC